MDGVVAEQRAAPSVELRIAAREVACHVCTLHARQCAHGANSRLAPANPRVLRRARGTRSVHSTSCGRLRAHGGSGSAARKCRVLGAVSGTSERAALRCRVGGRRGRCAHSQPVSAALPRVVLHVQHSRQLATVRPRRSDVSEFDTRRRCMRSHLVLRPIHASGELATAAGEEADHPGAAAPVSESPLFCRVEDFDVGARAQLADRIKVLLLQRGKSRHGALCVRARDASAMPLCHRAHVSREPQPVPERICDAQRARAPLNAHRRQAAAEQQRQRCES